jgi:hypothetical protein
MSVWMLKLERVGITDDFFEIGGDSLLVTQLVIVCEKLLKPSFPYVSFSLIAPRHNAAHLLSASPSLQTNAEIQKAHAKAFSSTLAMTIY